MELLMGCRDHKDQRLVQHFITQFQIFWPDASEFARAYADVLGAELELVDGAGHWPWLDKPEVVDLVADFLAG